jgi:hypothetical protein
LAFALVVFLVAAELTVFVFGIRHSSAQLTHSILEFWLKRHLDKFG